MKTKFLLLLCLLLASPMKLMAASATEEFIAKKTCSMFQSKKRGTNPGNIRSRINDTFPVIETLKKGSKPTWARVHTQANQSPQRWISAECGIFRKLKIRGSNQGDSQSSVSKCREPNKFDSNVLAISWQPAFCEIKGNSKKECSTLNSKRFDATHFTLHGLWPNKKSCGIKYGNCGRINKKPASFCDYPKLNLTTKVRIALGKVMPSAKYNTCLQRHEWWKHGTCSGRSQGDYYLLAMGLLDQINSSKFVKQFISLRVGQTLTKIKFKKEFEKSFGPGSFKKVRLVCNKKRRMLTELQIALPKNLNNQQRIKTLLSAPNVTLTGKSNCKNSFKLDGT